ncbi:palmitoyl-protein thioesterase 1 [Harpegnathos saltator]|uniref:Palmitoyl-protein thioesterase 1 n=1 Tax=Harpegnathos saltator TaxID=610380 RepID=E2BUW0_HARSA|nr:palmitoyl-protein thioesterase 1 [Harpegnathos saltator]EFN80497.1 Palmitoyl-protein thioesterase 1 [Harpegnathos saltator]
MVRVMQTWITNCACLFAIALFFLPDAGHCLHDEKNVTAISPTPIVLWHGMGDSCCFSFSLGKIQQILQNEIPNVYVNSIRIGDDVIQDVENSYLGNINEQIKQVCEQLQQDSRLQQGYNAIGFSQGAQFLRAIAQRCPDPPMQNLISLGGQHQGVYGLPRCSNTSVLCRYMRRMLYHGAYLWFIQESLVQAAFWHDPLNIEEYKKKNIFLSDINNENGINEYYKSNLQKLHNLVLVKFANDTMVEPVETEWFGFYKPGEAKEVQSLQESELYQEDRLGLRAMDMSGKLHFLLVPGEHLQFTDVWFTENIIKKFLIESFYN